MGASIVVAEVCVPAHVTVNPIDADRTDEWRGFVAALAGPRRIEWAQSQRRRGITREVISLAPGDPDSAVVYVETNDPVRSAEVLSASDHPFDEWYRSRLDELLGPASDVEVVFDSAPRPGPWRGVR